MSEQSGCDPQLAVRTRQQQAVEDGLKRLLVDGERAPDWFALQRDPGDETDHVDAERDAAERRVLETGLADENPEALLELLERDTVESDAA